MLLLDEDTLACCNTVNLERLANALGALPTGTYANEMDRRCKVIRAILKAEKHLSTQPRQVPAGAQPKPRGRNKRRAHR